MAKAAVYTRTGDKGTTGLWTGERVPKWSTRVEAYGTLDELNSTLGLARATVKRSDVSSVIREVQKTLMDSIMADVASLNPPEYRVSEQNVLIFEQLIDAFDGMLKPLGAFIAPGGSIGSAHLDLARTVARRAERQLLRLNEESPVNEHVLVCINRLSDLFFTLSRVEDEVE